MRIAAVIPARYASTRLPGKPLAMIHGKPMVQWVFERASEALGSENVHVATDDARVEQTVRGFGGQAWMTPPELNSGTDRVAAVARMLDAETVVNIQGDEPMLDPDAIRKTVELVRSGPFPMSTLMVPLGSQEELNSPSVVKVMADRNHRAIYFSRFPIPFTREKESGPPDSWVCKRHLGIYAFNRKTLFEFAAMPASPIERGESLEQLRALEAGIPIGVALANFVSFSVDTPEDLELVRLKIKG